MTKILLSLLALLPLALRGVSATCGPWVPEPLTSIAKARPGDTIDVLYLVAPLLECSEGGLLAYADAYHGGIGFRNTRTGDEVTVNFDASPSFTGAIKPDIVKLPNGTVELKWQNTGAAFIYHAPINYTYWASFSDVVGKVNGTVFNDFMFNYIAQANKTYHYYNIWSVFQSYPGKEWVANQECFNFVWGAFKELARLGSPVAPKTLPMSFVTLYSNTMPPKVDVSDQAQLKTMVAWYEELEEDLSSKGYLGYLAALWELLYKEVFYVRDNNYYYKVKLKFPYLGMHYVDVLTPQTGHDTCGGMC
jgi:hypothetical protein